MKDFDAARKEREQRDRGFLIGGEKFVRRAGLRPEEILLWNEATSGEKAPTEKQWIEVYDETILAMLEPGQDEKWEAVRANTESPLTVSDLLELIKWLLSEMTGRPTGPPSDSSAGRDSTGTTSMDDSGSPGLTAVSTP